ncbi:TPA: toprim domain-containing protein [Candidatus Micrarchaeota archaeon]|nr:toprim domain-containing protein [Candidatus Micrarchaeota archaeon]
MSHEDHNGIGNHPDGIPPEIGTAVRAGHETVRRACLGATKASEGLKRASEKLGKMREVLEGIMEKLRQFYAVVRMQDPRPLLSYLGIPYQDHGGYVLFCAPWRQDRNPSVSWHRTEQGEWLFRDHGGGQKGDHGTFLELMGWSKREARERLKEIYGISSVSTQKTVAKPRPTPNPESERKPVRAEVQAEAWRLADLHTIPEEGRKLLRLFSREWEQYRGLDFEDLQRWAYLVRMGKAWKIGFRNLSGGWEVLDLHLRPGCGKKTVGPKDITFWKGAIPRIYMVEGILDGLAIRKIDPHAGILVLNGVGQTEKALSFLQETVPRNTPIFLALDKDSAGQEATQKLLQGLQKLGLSAAVLQYRGKAPADGFARFGRDFVKKKINSPGGPRTAPKEGTEEKQANLPPVVG